MKTNGYVQPMPETESLWAELATAKAAGDRVAMGDLSAKIRRATVEAKREGGADGMVQA